MRVNKPFFCTFFEKIIGSVHKGWWASRTIILKNIFGFKQGRAKCCIAPLFYLFIKTIYYPLICSILNKYSKMRKP